MSCSTAILQYRHLKENMADLLDSNGNSVGNAIILVEVGTTNNRYVVWQCLRLTGVTYMWPNFQMVIIAEPQPGSTVGPVAVAFEGNNLLHASRLNPMEFTPSEDEFSEIKAWAVREVHDWVKAKIAEAATVPPAPVRINWDERNGC